MTHPDDCEGCPTCAEPDDEPVCPVCDGTGIGQHGDPDTSVCQSCRGDGRHQEDPGDAADRAYDDWRDRKMTGG